MCASCLDHLLAHMAPPPPYHHRAQAEAVLFAAKRGGVIGETKEVGSTHPDQGFTAVDHTGVCSDNVPSREVWLQQAQLLTEQVCLLSPVHTGGGGCPLLMGGTTGDGMSPAHGRDHWGRDVPCSWAGPLGTGCPLLMGRTTGDGVSPAHGRDHWGRGVPCSWAGPLGTGCPLLMEVEG